MMDGPVAPEPDTGSELQLISNTEPEPGRHQSVVSVSGTHGESGARWSDNNIKPSQMRDFIERTNNVIQ